jgi:hypothetical protein
MTAVGEHGVQIPAAQMLDFRQNTSFKGCTAGIGFYDCHGLVYGRDRCFLSYSANAALLIQALAFSDQRILSHLSHH